MKRIALTLSVAVMAIATFSCGNKDVRNATEAAKAETAKVMVYYFHSKQRCKTCVAIQRVAEEAIAANFANNSEVKFAEIDFTKKENEAIAKKYEIANSSLIVVSSGKHINLTEMAFANALRNPEVLKQEVINKVTAWLEQ